MASSLLGSLQTRKPSNNPVWSDGWVGNFADLVKHVRLPQSLPQDYYQHTKDGGYDFRFNEHILRGISPKRQRRLHHRKFPPRARGPGQVLRRLVCPARPNHIQSPTEGSKVRERDRRHEAVVHLSLLPERPRSASGGSSLSVLHYFFHTWFEFKTAPDDLLSMITSLWSTSCITSICREKAGRSTELISLVNNPNFLHGTKNKDHIKKLWRKVRLFMNALPH